MAKRHKSLRIGPKREILLFIVEGETDRIALENPINQYLDENGIEIEVRFCRLFRDREGNEITGGDITAAYGIRQSNYDIAISECIMRDLTILEGIYPKYITKVIQITDLDGVYISDDRVVFDKSADKTIYEDDLIKTSNVERIIKRNHRKRDVLEYLQNKTEIKLKTTSVDYSLYYFSCNIDHFLANKRNMEGCFKKGNASDFQGKCLDYSEYFIETFINSNFVARNMTYRDSWNLAKVGNNSLSRFSNTNLMLSDIIEWHQKRNNGEGKNEYEE